MQLKLVVVQGRASKNEVLLDEFPVLVGRTRSAGLPIGHSLVSRKHCEIDAVGGAIVVRDFGSSNGTRINDEKVTEAVLRPGDRLSIGPLTFEASYEPEVDLPEPQASGASNSDTLLTGFLASVGGNESASVAEALPDEPEDEEDTSEINQQELQQYEAQVAEGQANPKENASEFGWLYEDDGDTEQVDVVELDFDDLIDDK